MEMWRVLISSILAIIYGKTEDSETPVVMTECGQVSGQYIDGAYSFRGIPYAEPPIGNLRWKPPKPLNHASGNCWSGIFEAKQYGNTCYQISPDDKKTLIGSEDCLFLNVLTPTLNKNALKPVMVWIHGGSLQLSSGSWPLYRPTENLANQTDVVYVGFNYRLHAFGFMALQILADGSSHGVSGNYGFMDMITVLQWVQTNIQNFGGDPNQVTVFGQSSGGTAIFALLSSPLVQDLFHKAWLLSASPILNKTTADAYKDNEVFMKNAGCSDLQCLYNLTSEQVTRAVPWNTYPFWAMTNQNDLPVHGFFDGAIAIVDGFVIPKPPFDTWAAGEGIDVPLLIGSCANEIDYDPLQTDLNQWTWARYDEHVNQTIGTFGRHILENIRKLYPVGEISPEYQLTSLAADIYANCPNDVLALNAASNYKSPVYRYVVTSWPSAPVHAVGIPFPASYSFHMWDVLAFFGFIPDYIKTPTPEDIAWQRNVQNEVLSFVKTGKPYSNGWQTYPTTTALLSNVTSPTVAFHPVQCEFLLKNGFFSYAWIN